MRSPFKVEAWRSQMGDECTCEKCQPGSVGEPGLSVWPVLKSEAQMEDCGRRSQRNLYLVVTDGGISLRQRSYEM
jgi:hypothetical protein